MECEDGGGGSADREVQAVEPDGESEKRDCKETGSEVCTERKVQSMKHDGGDVLRAAEAKKRGLGD